MPELCRYLQLRYGSHSNAWQYDQEIGLQYQRNQKDDDANPLPDSVAIHTYASNLIRPKPYCAHNGPHFELEEGRLRSHKEQLIHLVGIIAIGNADQLATS